MAMVSGKIGGDFRGYLLKLGIEAFEMEKDFRLERRGRGREKKKGSLRRRV